MLCCLYYEYRFDHLTLTLLCCAVLCCAVLCCAVLCCAVLCCAVLCCAVLCCAVLCCAVNASISQQLPCPPTSAATQGALEALRTLLHTVVVVHPLVFTNSSILHDLGNSCSMPAVVTTQQQPAFALPLMGCIPCSLRANFPSAICSILTQATPNTLVHAAVTISGGARQLITMQEPCAFRVWQ